jgi:hypothetical protein
MTWTAWAVGAAVLVCFVVLLGIGYFMYAHRDEPKSLVARLVGSDAQLVAKQEHRPVAEVGQVDQVDQSDTRRRWHEESETAAVVRQLRDVLLDAQRQRDERDVHAQELVADALHRLREETARSSTALASASATAAEATTAAVASALAQVQAQAQAQKDQEEESKTVGKTRTMHVPEGPDGVSCRPGTRPLVPPGFKLFEQPYLVRVTAANYDVETGVLSVPVNRRNCHMFELVQATMPRLMYTVNAFCDTFVVYAAADDDDQGDKTAYGEYVVTLNRGDYTYTTLADELQTRINGATETTSDAAFNAGDVRTMTVSFDVNTQKYTFTLTTDGEDDVQRFYFKFTHPDLAYMLGFGFRDVFPHYTTIEDDSAVTHVVVDRDKDASEAVAVPPVVTSYPSIRVDDVRTVIHKVVLSAVTTISSAGRADLFGGRYVALTCDDLRQRYSNDSTVAWISQAADVNVLDLTEGSATFRRFPQPMPLDVLAMKLWIHLPTGKVAAADTSLLSFQLRFLTVFDNVTLRYDRHIPDKYD